MVPALCFVFGFQLAGTAVAHGFGLSVPGPVIGLLIMLGWLVFRLPKPKALVELAAVFLRYLPLLFVPAAVGVLQYLEILESVGLQLFAVILASTLAGLLTSVLVFTWVARRFSPPGGEELRKGKVP